MLKNRFLAIAAILGMMLATESYAYWHIAKVKKLRCYTQQWPICHIEIDRNITHSVPGGTATSNEFMIRSPRQSEIGGNVLNAATISLLEDVEVEFWIAQGMQFGLWEIFSIRLKNQNI